MVIKTSIGSIEIQIDPGNQLSKALEQASKLSDLTLPLTMISREWTKSNKAIFSLKGPGKYKDLSEKYKKQKQKKHKFIYPILKATGRLSFALTDPASPDAFMQIINKKTLFLGVKTGSGFQYPVFLQLGTKKMPPRPYFFIGPEQTIHPSINKRADAWAKILMTYVEGQLDGKKV